MYAIDPTTALTIARQRHAEDLRRAEARRTARSLRAETPPSPGRVPRRLRRRPWVAAARA